MTAWTLLMSMQTGQPLLLCDAGELTTARTAATTAVAVDALAPLTANRLAIIGSGKVAQAHLHYVKGLRDWQSIVFTAGASALMVGNYLTTLNQPVEKDLQMLKDLGLDPNWESHGFVDQQEAAPVAAVGVYSLQRDGKPTAISQSTRQECRVIPGRDG